MNNKGIVMANLIITILVIVALAAIAIYAGTPSLEKAKLSKYKSEVVEIEDKILLAAFDIEADFARRGIAKSKEEIYARTALGLTTNEEVPYDVEEIIPSDYAPYLEGTKCYKVASKDLYTKNTKDFDEIYITNRGEIFVTPGYITKEDGAEKVCINSSITILRQDFSKDMEVGHYVLYTPDRKNISIDANTTGANNTQTYETSLSVAWRIWKKNQDGSIVITPKQSIHSLTLSGANGIANSNEVISKICKMYTSSSLGITESSIRSIKLEDIEEVSSNLIAAKNNYRSPDNFVVGQKVKYTSGTFYLKEDGKTTTTTPNNVTANKPINIIQTYYWLERGLSAISPYNEMIGGEYTWTTTTLADCYNRDVVHRQMIFHNNAIIGEPLWNSNGEVFTLTWKVRPLITISGIHLDTLNPGNGSSDSPWKLIK